MGWGGWGVRGSDFPTLRVNEPSPLLKLCIVLHVRFWGEINFFFRGGGEGRASRDFSGPIRHALKGFRMLSNIRGVVCLRDQLPGVFTTGETRPNLVG